MSGVLTSLTQLIDKHKKSKKLKKFYEELKKKTERALKPITLEDYINLAKSPEGQINVVKKHFTNREYKIEDALDSIDQYHVTAAMFSVNNELRIDELEDAVNYPGYDNDTVAYYFVQSAIFNEARFCFRSQLHANDQYVFNNRKIYKVFGVNEGLIKLNKVVNPKKYINVTVDEFIQYLTNDAGVHLNKDAFDVYRAKLLLKQIIRKKLERVQELQIRRLVNDVLKVDVLSELVTQNLLDEPEQEAIVDREIRRIYELVQGSCQR